MNDPGPEALLLCFLPLGICYGDQANEEVLGHICLIVGTLNLWNHSVVILMEIHLITGSTPQHTHTHTHTRTIL